MGRLDLQPSGLDFREVEDVADHVQEVLAVAFDGGKGFAAMRGAFSIPSSVSKSSAYPRMAVIGVGIRGSCWPGIRSWRGWPLGGILGFAQIIFHSLPFGDVDEGNNGPTTFPSFDCGWDQYSAGKLVPSFRQVPHHRHERLPFPNCFDDAALVRRIGVPVRTE